MSDVSERRRKPRRNHSAHGEPIWVALHDVPGSTDGIRAKVLDASDLGLGVETDRRLDPNIMLTVEGQVGPPGASGKMRARVVDCRPFQGGFRSGLRFEASSENGNGTSAASGDPVPDYYEVLQISPNADPDMIHRVYRLLAQRYHPDNKESGDEKAFRAITDAYKVLSEPEKRAAYDVSLHAYRQVRWRIFDQCQASIGKVDERSTRERVL